MPSPVEVVDDENFETTVLTSEQPYLLDFSATWCPPCKALDPILEALAEQFQGQLRVGKINIDTNPKIPSRYQVRGAPTLLLFKNGQEAERKLGLTNRQTLLKLTGL
jgi:thioredoxin 1